MTVELTPAKPSDENNGLALHADDLMKAHPKPILAVVVIERIKRVLPDGERDPYPVVRFTRIEPVLADDVDAVTAAMERAASVRGQAQLDMDGGE